MAKVVVSLLAQLDEAHIARGLAREAGQRTAAKYVAAFGGLYVRLGNYPESGAPRPSLGANVRIGVVTPYIVPYRYETATDTVTILRIIHGRRKLTGAMLVSDNNS
jgi:toxin ParE1/3/4